MRHLDKRFFAFFIPFSLACVWGFCLETPTEALAISVSDQYPIPGYSDVTSTDADPSQGGISSVDSETNLREGTGALSSGLAIEENERVPRESDLTGAQSGELATPIQDGQITSTSSPSLIVDETTPFSGTNKLVSLASAVTLENTSASPSESHPGGDAGPSRSEQIIVAQNSSRAEVPQARAERPYGEIPITVNPAVEESLRYFQTVIPERFQEWLTRFYQYQPVLEQIFAEFQLPTELVFLSIVESGFNPRAYSRARAAGPWQFMKSTGRLYGLQVDWYVDERRDPIKSTVAAAQHLRDLYDRFGSWPLALAAYNAGAGKITRAIQRAKTKDFWEIRNTRYIRRETKNYVPRFMAATIIASNPFLYGFSGPSGDRHQYGEVLLTQKAHLRSIAEETGIPLEELRRLNPELRRSITPPSRDGYFLKVPVGMRDRFEEVRGQIAAWTQPEPPEQEWYRIRRGDSLSTVAHRFGMSVAQLKEMNNLSSSIIRAGDRLRVLVSEKTSQERDTKWYRVRQGDSLWSIAQRFRVSVRDLKALNNLTSSFLPVGRLLMISD